MYRNFLNIERCSFVTLWRLFHAFRNEDVAYHARILLHFFHKEMASREDAKLRAYDEVFL